MCSSTYCKYHLCVSLVLTRYLMLWKLDEYNDWQLRLAHGWPSVSIGATSTARSLLHRLWRQQFKMAAPVSRIFWLGFCRVAESGDTSSVFICSLITDVENVRTRTDQLVFPLSLCIKERSFSASVPLIPIPLPVLLHLSFLSLEREGGGGDSPICVWSRDKEIPPVTNAEGT